MWGRMLSCGRLAIGLAGFVPGSKPITNRLQVANLPQCAQHGQNLVGWKEPTGTDDGNRSEPQGVAAR